MKTLSDKIHIGKFAPTNSKQYVYYAEEDVKQSIKEFKEDLMEERTLRLGVERLRQKIEKLALKHFGNKLIEEKQ